MVFPLARRERALVFSEAIIHARSRFPSQEEAMFKRGKDAGAAAGRPAKIGTLAAGLGGLLGGLLFWRKRKAN
jgi:hypothetical protein